MDWLNALLNTIAYGLIIIGVLFGMVDTLSSRARIQRGFFFFLNVQVGIVFIVAGFALLIIAAWVS